MEKSVHYSELIYPAFSSRVSELILQRQLQFGGVFFSLLTELLPSQQVSTNAL